MPICRAIPPPLGPNDRVGSFAACQTYIEGQERDRPSHTFSRGVVSLDTAALEMDAQADLSRCKDPVCHWIISYHSDEPATNQVIEADTYQLLRAIDLGRHQFIAAVHDDTDNRHVHVVANRVGPDGLAAQMAWFKLRSERCMARAAFRRGVAIVPGKFNRDLLAKQQTAQGEPGRDRSFAPDIRSRLNGRDRARLERGGDLPWYELARPAVVEAAKNASGWQQFSAALSRHGIVLKHTVRIARKDGPAFHGLAFAEGHEAGAPGCKASAVGSEFRYKALAARWGDYPDDAEGRARAALLNRPGIPGRGEVARTRGEGREAAWQRRARALGSTVALEAGSRLPLDQFTNDNVQARTGLVAVSGSERHQWLGAEPDAQVPTTSLARSVISLSSAQRAVEYILTGLRAKAGRSKRRRRMDNLQRWSSGLPTVSESKSQPNGRRRQIGGILRTQVPSDSGEGHLPDWNIKDHHSLKQKFDAYRTKERLTLKVSEDEAWREAWSQEQAIRQQEHERLRRSEQVKRRLIVDGLQPGRLRRVWLEGLKLRYRYKRARLRTRQSERWARTRSEWTANRTRAEPLGYKVWLRERAATDPVAGRHYAWIDSMDARRVAVVAAAPTAQGGESSEQQIQLSGPDTMLPDRIDSAEPSAQPEAGPVSHSDMKRDPADMSPGDFRLLAAAKRAGRPGNPLTPETGVEDKDVAESDAMAGPSALAVQHDIGDQTGSARSRNSQDRAEMPTVMAAAQGETAHVPVGASPLAEMALDARVEEGEEASSVEVSEEDSRISDSAEHQGREVAPVSHSELSIGAQAREVALWSQTRAALGGIVPDGMAENPSQEARETKHARQAQNPAGPAPAPAPKPAPPKTAESAAQPPETHYRPEPFHKPAGQGEAAAPPTTGPVGSPMPALGISEPKSPSPAARLVPEQTPTAPQATVQPGPKHGTAPTDGISTAEAPARASAPESPASASASASAPAAPIPAAPPLVSANPSEEAAIRAVAALRVQHPLTGSDHLRETAKAAAQSLAQMRPTAAPPTSASTKSDEPIAIDSFDPLRDADGQQRNPLLQQIASTVIHAHKCDDQNLLDTAFTLLSVCLDRTGDLVVPIAGGILKWHSETNKKPSMLPLSIDGCRKVTEYIVRKRQAGFGDDWMWNWEGLPRDRTPSRPKPGRDKNFGIND